MEQRKLLKTEENCSACGACLAACPRQAISMQEDEYGCLYPVIQLEQCVHCGICERICPYGQTEANPSCSAECYAAAATCRSLARASASGGIFAALAVKVLEDGGMAAGAVMDCGEQLQVYHVLSDKIEDVRRMQGSKYVQSEAWRCYQDVQNALKEGKTVLFSGTPCQVDAVKKMTGNPERLITVDLICHGVPPQKMLDEYVRILNRRFQGQLIRMAFRDKTCGKPFCASLVFARGHKERTFFAKAKYLSFYQHFLNGDIYRENCYSCPYAKTERIADLTLGDYWGVHQAHAAEMENGVMNPETAWSCVMVHTEKGKKFLERCEEKLELHPSQLEWIVKENKQLLAPCSKTEKREKVLRNYLRGGYAAVEKAFIRDSCGILRYYKRLIVELADNRKKSKG